MHRTSQAAVLAVLAGCSFEGVPPADDTDPVADAPAGADAAVDASADASPLCVGYTAAGSSQYRLVTAPADWLAAELDCEDDEPGVTHLAIIQTELERMELDVLATSDVWLGLVDRRLEGTWVWVDGSAHTIAMPPWKAGEPSTGGSDDCAILNNGGLYDAVNCTDDKQYVCECDGIAAVAAAYTP